MVSYNAQAMKERRGRLPYVDAQTGIAQADNYNWKKRSDRQRGILPGDVLWCAFIRGEKPNSSASLSVEIVSKGLHAVHTDA